MDFSIIAAIDQNRGIGKGNQLPWHLSADLKHFAKTTKGGTVIMGRKTWESLPDNFRPLKGRLNIVVTQNKDYYLPHGAVLANSLDDALEKSEGETFVIGGATLYREAILHPSCKKLLLTELHKSFDCDAHFPEIPTNFRRAEESETYEGNGISYSFVVYVHQVV